MQRIWMLSKGYRHRPLYRTRINSPIRFFSKTKIIQEQKNPNEDERFVQQIQEQKNPNEDERFVHDPNVPFHFYKPKTPQEEFDRSNKVIQVGLDGDLMGPVDNMVSGFSETSFRLNDVCLYGSIVVFSDSYFLWRARVVEDITIESLNIVLMKRPPTSLLLLGTGENHLPISQKIIDYFESKGTTIEASRTVEACGTFNFLIQERRSVALAALVLKPEGESSKK